MQLSKRNKFRKIFWNCGDGLGKMFKTRRVAGVHLVSLNHFHAGLSCVHTPLRPYITNSMIWTSCDWLNKFKF